jgi:hypothetical protein
MSSKRISRRQAFLDAGAGFGWLAVSALSAAASPAASFPHFAPKAKRVLQIFSVGGMSHLDTFDFKPELAKRNGQPFSMPTFFGQGGNLLASPFAFERRGQSGLWVSNLLPHLASHADKLTIVRTMVSKSANHMPAVACMNTGFVLTGFPSMGAWVTYALGSERDNLPSFVVLPDHRAHPWGGAVQWSNGFLPAAVQGTLFRGQSSPVPDLQSPHDLPPTARSAALDWVQLQNRQFASSHPGDSSLDARIRSYELAAAMQLSVPAAADLSSESPATRQFYGFDQPHTEPMARRCLLARRLIEQGVRFVQVYHGGSSVDWDAHGSLADNHSKRAAEYDQPVAALLADLHSRGLLADTLVLGVTEFGRTPVSQGAGSSAGRDHHPDCFSCWMAGAGLKPGFAFGESDDFGYKPASHPVSIHDFHATALHLLGLDHERLNFYHNGIRRRLTDVHGQVVHGFLAS